MVLLKGTATAKIENRQLSDVFNSYDGLNSQFSAHSMILPRRSSMARALAAPGDVVLLSPGCASFGMFQNEFHRGDEFRRIVNGFNG